MRKVFVGLALTVVLALGITVGMSTAPAPADAGFCWYECGCNGVPMKCCYGPYGVACKPDPNAPIQCPQVSDC